MPSLTLQNMLAAALLAALIAGATGLLRALSFSGALAAFAVGFFIFGFGGVAFAVPLLAFFLSSSLLSRLGGARGEAGGKDGPRDAWQVLANGAIPAGLAVAASQTTASRDVLLLYLCALAAVNADTWATEAGVRLGGRPWALATLRRVEPGSSGAVSLAGLAASLAGAALIAAAGWAAWPQGTTALLWRIDPPELIAVAWAGFAAAFADSVLGASLQGVRRCRRCGALTEAARHCGAAASPARGVPWVTNDVVNVLASAAGVLFGWALLRWFAYPLSSAWF